MSNMVGVRVNLFSFLYCVVFIFFSSCFVFRFSFVFVFVFALILLLSCVSNVARDSALDILDSPFSFILCVQCCP
jgi:hypothetical protein